ncbi:MAG: C40 family peptidase [Actinomycetes bacterium]
MATTLSRTFRATLTRDPAAKRSRRWLDVSASLLISALLAGGLTAPAVASPHHPKPSAADVQRARAAAVDARTRVAQARADYSSAVHELSQVDARLELVVEKWNEAQAQADQAQQALDVALVAETSARGVARSAQVDVDRLAVASYQVGADLSGGLGELAAVIDSAFAPGGISGLVDRTTDVGLIAGHHRQQLTAAVTSRLDAEQTSRQRALISAQVQARQADVATALASVRGEESAQRSAVAALSATRDAAMAVLTKALGKAATLAQERADALAAEAAARARAEAAARLEAARLARARAAANAHGGGTGSAGSSSGGGQTTGSGGGHYRPWPQGGSYTTAAQRLGAVAFARAQLGKPYVAGTNGPNSYDCSGLTSAAYRSVGVSMIHYSQAQFAAGEKIPISQLQVGDLVFFATDTTDWRTIHHVAIYAGNGQMIEAPHTGDHVKVWTIWLNDLVPFGVRP